jgi:hypothetical protein
LGFFIVALFLSEFLCSIIKTSHFLNKKELNMPSLRTFSSYFNDQSPCHKCYTIV